MKNECLFSKRVNPEDIRAGEALVEEYKKWVGPGGAGYGIIRKGE